MTGQLNRVDVTVLPLGWTDLTSGPIASEVSGSWSPALSPDGRHCAYVSDRSGRPQVWVQPVGSELAFLVDTGAAPVAAVQWSSGGGWLAVQVAPGGAPRHEVWLVRPDGSGLHQVAGFGTDTADNMRWLPGRPLLALTENLTTAILVDPVASARMTVTTGELITLLDVSPGGDRALLRVGPRGSRTVVERDLPTGTDTVVAVGEQAVYGPDGTTVHVRDESGEFPTLVVGGAVAAKAHDAEIEAFALTADGSRTAILWNVRGGESEISFLTDKSGAADDTIPDSSLAAGATDDTVPDSGLATSATDDTVPDSSLAAETTDDTTLGSDLAAETTNDTNLGSGLAADAGDGAGSGSSLDIGSLSNLSGEKLTGLPGSVVSNLCWSSDGSTLAFTAEGPGRPHGVWIYSDKSGIVAVSAEPVDPNAVEPTLEIVEAHDGLTLTGWLFRPATPGPHPTVLWLHGGPEAQERPGHGPLFQSLVARGIAVFAPNVRGSSGFGRSFVNADNGALRYAAIEDVRSCVRHLVNYGIADKSRVGCMGRSYGGYLTLAALTSFPDLFAAGIDVCGMSNFATFYEHTEPWIAAAAVSKYGDPATDAALLADLSPITRIDRLRAPLMVVHGENDSNVPVIEAEQVVAALAARGVPHRYLLFPDEGHELLHRSSRADYLRETVDWLTTHLA